MKKSVGFIPLRKGSKGIPGKNKKDLAGKPLYQWILDEAILSNLDEVFVFTDDEEIFNEVSQNYASQKVKALIRSAESASDTASTEFAMIEFANQIDYNFSTLCLLQATSPLTNTTAINNALSKMETEDIDSLVSVVRTHRFVWNEDGTSKNYDIFKRPRRQDFKGLLIENGAIYCTTISAFKNSKNRISGAIGLLEMNEDTLIEIDTLTDWVILEQLLLAKNH
ncbi:acylneuraminate cytidylyltransferase family protein [Croceibacter atlanticus]|uniref:acylneuraminate cytidylyltransferase family protein n=1 Tax=Croceibacter atlanticus TaxID=313588 RepID=UPI0030FA4CB2